MSKDTHKNKEEQASERRLLNLDELSRVTGGVDQPHHHNR